MESWTASKKILVMYIDFEIPKICTNFLFDILVAYVSDGASVMMGHHGGLQAVLKEVR